MHLRQFPRNSIPLAPFNRPLIGLVDCHHIPFLSLRTFTVSRFQLGKPNAQELEELAEARSWLTNFSPASIPRSACALSFSRSSGPGGQNVNKVNSKATLRFDVQKNASFFHPLILQRLLNGSSRYLTKDRSELVIHSDTSRRQNDNVEECFKKLYDLVVESADLPGETSVEQEERVKNLKRADNERRIGKKKHHSGKKASRSGRDD